jgi:hypothetical protein
VQPLLGVEQGGGFHCFVNTEAVRVAAAAAERDG